MFIKKEQSGGTAQYQTAVMKWTATKRSIPRMDLDTEESRGGETRETHNLYNFKYYVLL